MCIDTRAAAFAQACLAITTTFIARLIAGTLRAATAAVIGINLCIDTRATAVAPAFVAATQPANAGLVIGTHIVTITAIHRIRT